MRNWDWSAHLKVLICSIPVEEGKLKLIVIKVLKKVIALPSSHMLLLFFGFL